MLLVEVHLGREIGRDRPLRVGVLFVVLDVHCIVGPGLQLVMLVCSRIRVHRANPFPLGGRGPQALLRDCLVLAYCLFHHLLRRVLTIKVYL